MKIINNASIEILVEGSKLHPSEGYELPESGFNTCRVKSDLGDITITTEYSKRSFKTSGSLVARELNDKDSNGMSILSIEERIDMKERRPLYCFKLMEKTGEIQKLEITDYEELTNSYRWEQTGGYIEYIYKKDMNKVKNNKVYSFDDNIENCVEMIYRSLSEKKDKADKDLQKYRTVMHQFCQKYMPEVAG